MSPWTDGPTNEEEPVVLDIYGIKAELKPGDLGEKVPTSWSDVRDQLRGHLLRLAVAPTRLLAELFEGTTRLVRGISSIPGATASRIRRAHAQADQDEDLRQAKTAGRKLTSGDSYPDGQSRGTQANAAELVERLESILQRVRAQGRDATVVLMRDGSILVVLGTAENARAEIEAVAEDMLLMLTLSAAQDTDVTHSDSGLSAAGGLSLPSGEASAPRPSSTS